MRDVLLVQRDRAVVALVEDNPGFARMYRDERVELCRYSGEPLEDVLDELEMSARLCAMVFDGLEPAALGSPARLQPPQRLEHWPSQRGLAGPSHRARGRAPPDGRQPSAGGSGPGLTHRNYASQRGGHGRRSRAEVAGQALPKIT